MTTLKADKDKRWLVLERAPADEGEYWIKVAPASFTQPGGAPSLGREIAYAKPPKVPK